MYGDKIRSIREMRGFSQEYLSQKLGIAQNSYSRMENNQTKLSSEILEKLAKELGVSPMDILSSEPFVVNFYGANHGSQGNFNTIENLYTGQKDLYEKMLSDKDKEIYRLNKLLETLIAKK
ncbi:MAG: helix-turn-helix domain protein [Mucilaginibacter sp.]|nr:helix-turn-helix domain protein [Mucilaginibacter sp.]